MKVTVKHAGGGNNSLIFCVISALPAWKQIILDKEKGSPLQKDVWIFLP